MIDQDHWLTTRKLPEIYKKIKDDDHQNWLDKDKISGIDNGTVTENLEAKTKWQSATIINSTVYQWQRDIADLDKYRAELVSRVDGYAAKNA